MSVSAKFPIGSTGITNYLLVIIRRVSNPSVEEQRFSFGPSPGAINLDVFNLDPVNYDIDFRNSPDGTSLGVLISSFTFNAQSNQIIAEKLFYTVGGAGAHDPANGATTIIDPYFIDKDITGVFKESFRFLVKGTEWDITADTITIMGGTKLVTDEVVIVEITYKNALPTTSNNNGMFTGVNILTDSATIDSTFYNKRTKCTGNSIILVATLPDISTVPDGALLYFQSYGGAQKFTKILCTGTDKLFWDGFDLTVNEFSELWIGKGEFIYIEKSGSYWEVIDISPTVADVGKLYDATYKAHPNSGLEDASIVYDGDENPRIWWWLNTIYPSTSKIVDDTVVNSNYAHPSDKLGLPVLHSTLKKFRLGDLRGMVKKGLANFSTYGGDAANRPYDYPGGFQDEMILAHSHNVPARTGSISTGLGGANFPAGKNADVPTSSVGGTQQRVKNIGVICCRRF